MTYARIYWVWRSMKARCLNPKHKSYRTYGGRGIAVCERWLTFEFFLADMGIPGKNDSIERIDNDKGYCPENCCWILKEDQARNRRTNRTFTVGEVKMTLTDWCKHYGVVGYFTAVYRLNRGWPFAMALTMPPTTNRRRPSGA